MSDRRKKLDVIKALLAKTVENGCTEAEAMAALAKARELMDAYEIDESDIAVGGEEVIQEKRKRDPLEVAESVATAVGAFTETQAFRGRDGQINYIGLESDVIFAGWLLDMLESFVTRAVIAHLQTVNAPSWGEWRHFQRSFVMGCTSRICARLYEIVNERRRNRPTGNGRDLMVVKSALIKARMKEMGIELSRTRSSSRTVNAGSYADGAAAANRANFNRPVNQGAGVRAIGR